MISLFVMPAYGYVFFRHCYSYNQEMNIGYESCVNSNFYRLDNELAAFLFSCHSYGEVDYSYENCVNHNFRSISIELNIFLVPCMNIGPGLGSAFQSCINNNFQTIGRWLD